MTTGDPTGWKLTSVRWLKENAREYLPARGRADLPAHDRLKAALATMSYLETEAATPDGAVSRPAAIALRDAALRDWGEQAHNEMAAFVQGGGLATTWTKRFGAELPKEERADKKPRKRKAASFTHDWAADGEAAEPARASQAHPQDSAEDDLEDVVRLLANPNQGSW